MAALLAPEQRSNLPRQVCFIMNVRLAFG